MTADDSDPMIESQQNQIKLDIRAESFAIDNHNKGRKKSKRHTEANVDDNLTQNIDHQFIEVTPEEILSQNCSQSSSPSVPRVTTRSQSKLKRKSRRGRKRKNN